MMLSKPKKVKKSSRPTRDEFEMEELGNAIEEAYREKIEVIVTIWQREPLKGKISKLDGETKTVHILSEYETHKVKFIDILKVESAPR
ncbi:YolD-like family protein [Sutcliffiella horikoshii]|uniref:YolD-like family protein n=1 Tax=Sutcliffiella horikoshii TaxID=79883 RepID=UPI00203FA653|nr:YolD-like family protein [Sutcliffiella horikoshii]MCM3620528.1 YolD-like family protein [Sutcliffiella horikoshii]